MSIVPLINPFKPYVQQYLAPLQGKIVEWLAGLEKTMDDVVWWKMTGEPLIPYQFFGYKIYIIVSFAGSKDKFNETFIWNGMEEEIR
jgi:hypothetical protein